MTEKKKPTYLYGLSNFLIHIQVCLYVLNCEMDLSLGAQRCSGNTS